jgi:plastocyanin
MSAPAESVTRQLVSVAIVAVLATAVTADVHAQTRGTEPTPDTTIVLKSAGSALEFIPARISVRNGLRVRVRYTNDGTLPHNLAFAKSEDDLDAIASAAYAAGATGFVPLEHKDKLIAWSSLVSPGQTVDVTFVVPPPGEYPFICLFPGHANMMNGVLRSLR